MEHIFWSYGETGAGISAVFAAVGTFFTALLGGWDTSLWLLIGFIVLDFILGILAAVKSGQLNSKTMFWGGVNKLVLLAFVSVGHGLDSVLPIESPFVRTAVIWFYLGREGLSCIENYARLGGSVPDFIRKTLEQLREQGDGGNEQCKD